MRPRYSRSRDRGRYPEPVEEARENVARRDYQEALDELEDRDPDSLLPPDEDYRPRRRGRPL